MSDDLGSVRLPATIHDIRTTVDGGWRVSFNLANDNAVLIAQLSALRDCALMLKITPSEDAS